MTHSIPDQSFTITSVSLSDPSNKRADTRRITKLLNRQEKSAAQMEKDMQKKLQESVDHADETLMKHLVRIEGDRLEAERRDAAETINVDIVSTHSTLRQLNPLSYCSKGVTQTYRIENNDAAIIVSGALTSEGVIRGAIEVRVGEAVHARRRVLAIEVRDSPVSYLSDSVCGVFKPPIKGDGTPPSVLLASEAISFLLESQLLHLAITSTNLQTLDPSVNRFGQLLTLDLSRNQIVRITEPIELPQLLFLDLSNNLLSSIGFLEGLRSLQSLGVSANCLTVLEGAVNSLIPLGLSLKHFDMSKNGVSLTFTNPFYSIFKSFVLLIEMLVFRAH